MKNIKSNISKSSNDVAYFHLIKYWNLHTLVIIWIFLMVVSAFCFFHYCLFNQEEFKKSFLKIHKTFNHYPATLIDFLSMLFEGTNMGQSEIRSCRLVFKDWTSTSVLLRVLTLLNLSSWCLVRVERLFLGVPRGCLQFVIVVFPDHTNLLFFIPTKIQKYNSMIFMINNVISMTI